MKRVLSISILGASLLFSASCMELQGLLGLSQPEQKFDQELINAVLVYNYANRDQGSSSCNNLIGGTIQGCGLSLSGVVTTSLGTGGTGSAEGTGTAASFNFPNRITTDGTNLYIGDSINHKIRKVVISSLEVTTLAGSGATGSTDATGTAATFNTPFGVVTDGTHVWVADNQSNKIRQIVIATGEVTTLAGSGAAGSADGTGTAATFNQPTGITTDGTNLYVADINTHIIRKIVISSGEVTTIAGTGGTGSADGTGTAASFNAPGGLAYSNGFVYVGDSDNHNIRRIDVSTNAVTTIAGTGGTGSANGTGTAASFNTPLGVVSDGINLYVADSMNHLVRKIVLSSQEVTTVAGSGSTGSADGTGTAATFNEPRGLTSDGSSLFVVDNQNHLIRRIQ